MIYKTNEFNNTIKIFNEEFISNNMKRAKIIIKNKQYDLNENIKNEKQKIKVEIKFIDNIIKLNCMFGECKSLYSVHIFKNLITKYLRTIFGLFYECISLINIDDISNWNINNINDNNISGLFYKCSSLKELPDISKWNINNINYKNYLFFGCSSLLKLPDISIWDISKVIICDYLFGECSSLESLPDISKWNTINIKSLSGLFYKCKSLKILPDISKWNTSNVFNLSDLFKYCSSLKVLPDISKWNVNNIIALKGLFFNCSSLISLPDISKWNIFNSNINNYILYLESINYFNEKNIRKELELLSLLNGSYNNDLYLENIEYQFPELKSYTKEEYIKLLLNAAYNMSGLFAGCSSLKNLPDVSEWNIKNSKI